MKMQTLVNMMGGLEKKFKIGLDELLLLSYLSEKFQKKDEVTITFLLNHYPFCSPATTHARMKKLLNAYLIDTSIGRVDTRIKYLVKGKYYDDLVKYLGEI